MDEKTLDEFVAEFNPRRYYRMIRKLGFEKENARTMTCFYAEKVYQPTLNMYRLEQ